jgi:hypothetical protein
MKKFFLYLLLSFFVAGLATLAYGFWSAKNIRKWAKAVAGIRLQHDIASQEKDIAQKMNASGGKKVPEFGAELSGFSSDLDAVAKELEAAESEMGSRSVPREAKSVRSELDDYYQKSGNQIQDMNNVVKYLTMVFNVTSIFDKMNPDSTAEEIRGMIADAKEKSKAVDAGILPVAMRSSGNELKVAVEGYLDQFDQYANGKAESHDQLNESYADFSEKLNDFLIAKKNYFDTFDDLDSLGRKIDEHLMILERVRFSIK